MTIFEAQSILLDYFSKKGNDHFSFDKNFKDLQIITGNDIEDDHSIVELALMEFCKSNILIKYPERNFWVLTKPLQLYSQNVELSSQTCSAIADIVNGECEKLGEERWLVDPLNIKENDVQKLIIIIDNLIKMASELGEKND